VNCARTHDSRVLDYSALKGDGKGALRRAILHFVRGIRGERKREVTRKQILTWFRGTPTDFVEAAILDAVTDDLLNCCRTTLVRRSNERYVYELTEKGRRAVDNRDAPSERCRHCGHAHPLRGACEAQALGADHHATAHSAAVSSTSLTIAPKQIRAAEAVEEGPCATIGCENQAPPGEPFCPSCQKPDTASRDARRPEPRPAQCWFAGGEPLGIVSNVHPEGRVDFTNGRSTRAEILTDPDRYYECREPALADLLMFAAAREPVRSCLGLDYLRWASTFMDTTMRLAPSTFQACASKRRTTCKP